MRLSKWYQFVIVCVRVATQHPPKAAVQIAMSISVAPQSRGVRFFGERLPATRPCATLNAVFLTLFMVTSLAHAGSIIVTLPADLAIEKAVATTEKEPKASITGALSKDGDKTRITFKDPVAGSAYEVQLTLKDGTVLQGVDMGWYSRVPDKAGAEALSDDDKKQMEAVFTAGSQFFNVQEDTLLKGNQNRAVMLVRLERANFHSDTGDEVIWRPELWYFENHHGGWEKVLQTDRVLRRERFKTHAEYHAVVDKLKWVPELGGLKSTPKNPDVQVTLPANAGVPTVAPATQPAGSPADAGRH